MVNSIGPERAAGDSLSRAQRLDRRRTHRPHSSGIYLPADELISARCPLHLPSYRCSTAAIVGGACGPGSAEHSRVSSMEPGAAPVTCDRASLKTRIVELMRPAARPLPLG